MRIAISRFNQTKILYVVTSKKKEPTNSKYLSYLPL